MPEIQLQRDVMHNLQLLPGKYSKSRTTCNSRDNFFANTSSLETYVLLQDSPGTWWYCNLSCSPRSKNCIAWGKFRNCWYLFFSLFVCFGLFWLVWFVSLVLFGFCLFVMFVFCCLLVCFIVCLFCLFVWLVWFVSFACLVGLVWLFVLLVCFVYLFLCLVGLFLLFFTILYFASFPFGLFVLFSLSSTLRRRLTSTYHLTSLEYDKCISLLYQKTRHVIWKISNYPRFLEKKADKMKLMINE